VADALKFLGLFVRDFMAELLLQSHDQLNGIERIGAKILDELGIRGDLVRGRAQLLDDNIFYSLFDCFFSHGYLRFFVLLQCVYATNEGASSPEWKIFLSVRAVVVKRVGEKSLFHHITIPPSTVNTCPVMYRAPGLARNNAALAMSSAWPK